MSKRIPDPQHTAGAFGLQASWYEQPQSREDAPCPFCGKHFTFPLWAEKITCLSCKSTWIRPITSSRSLRFRSGEIRVALGRRSVGRVCRSRYPFQHAIFQEPAVQEFRRRYPDLREPRGRTQWEQQRAWMRWLRLKKFIDRPSREELLALGMGGFTRNSDTWFCTHQAYLFTLFAMGRGWTARILNIGRDNPDKSFGHMIAEIWNDDLQKWIVLDPLYAAWFSLRSRREVPLSFLEVRENWLTRRGEDLLVHHGVIASGTNQFHRREHTMPAARYDGSKNRALHPSTYFWGVALLSNRYLTDPYESARYTALLWSDSWNDGRSWINSGQPVGYYLSRHLEETCSPRDFHPSLNNTAVWIRIAEKELPRVFLQTITPNFSHFEIQKGLKWHRIPAEFSLTPRRAHSLLRVRAVNFFGLAGKSTDLLTTLSRV